MNLKLKALYVAIAMTVAGAAQAAPISIDGFTPATGGVGNGSSQIIFSVLDGVSNQSIIVNTGLTVSQFRNNNAALIGTFSFTDTGLQSFFSTNAANLSKMRWNLGAVSNGPDNISFGGFGPNTGVLISNGNNNPSTLPTPSDASVLQFAQANAANYALANNAKLVNSNSAVSASLSPSGYIGSSNWGGTLGGALLFSNELIGFGGGQTLSYFGFDQTDPLLPATSAAYTNGQFRVDTALGKVSYVSTNVSTVPVPAAVWLLGSGLAGLVGIGRRRKQV